MTPRRARLVPLGRERSHAAPLPAATLAALAFLCASTIAPWAKAATPATDDPWWGEDKALHFSLSLGIAALGYGLGAWTTDDRVAAAAMGAGIAIGLGAAKEGLDATGLGDPSWKDFTWNLIGAAAGVGLSLTFDLALRGPHVSEPADPPVVRATSTAK